MNKIEKASERQWINTYGGDTKLWDDELDESNNKDVALVAYISGYEDAEEKHLESTETKED